MLRCDVLCLLCCAVLRHPAAVGMLLLLHATRRGKESASTAVLSLPAVQPSCPTVYPRLLHMHLAVGRQQVSLLAETSHASSHAPHAVQVLVNGVPLGFAAQDVDRPVCAAIGGPGAGKPPLCASINERLFNGTCTWWYA